MIDSAFISEINKLSEQTIELCYHCHKCTAGCPVALDMEYGPDRTLRMVQLGQKQELLNSHDIWLCASCETCGARCPNEIDIARVMDALRQMALVEDAPVAEPDVLKFHKVFLFVVQNAGRMYEAGLFGAYKFWTMHLMADMDSGVKMILKGKIPLVPQILKNRKDVQKLFAESKKSEA